MTYYQNNNDGLIYTEDEARRFTQEQLYLDDIQEAMAAHYRLMDLFKLLPEDEQNQIIDEAIDEKKPWLFTTDCKDEFMFAHDCPGHEV